MYVLVVLTIAAADCISAELIELPNGQVYGTQRAINPQQKTTYSELILVSYRHDET